MHASCNLVCSWFPRTVSKKLFSCKRVPVSKYINYQAENRYQKRNGYVWLRRRNHLRKRIEWSVSGLNQNPTFATRRFDNMWYGDGDNNEITVTATTTTKTTTVHQENAMVDSHLCLRRPVPFILLPPKSVESPDNCNGTATVRQKTGLKLVPLVTEWSRQDAGKMRGNGTLRNKRAALVGGRAPGQSWGRCGTESLLPLAKRVL